MPSLSLPVSVPAIATTTMGDDSLFSDDLQKEPVKDPKGPAGASVSSDSSLLKTLVMSQGDKLKHLSPIVESSKTGTKELDDGKILTDAKNNIDELMAESYREQKSTILKILAGVAVGACSLAGLTVGMIFASSVIVPIMVAGGCLAGLVLLTGLLTNRSTE